MADQYIPYFLPGPHQIVDQRPTNWQEECVLLFPDEPFPQTAEEIRARLLRHVSTFPDPEFRARNIAQIEAFSDEELAGRLSPHGRLMQIKAWALGAVLVLNYEPPQPKGASDEKNGANPRIP